MRLMPSSLAAAASLLVLTASCVGPPARDPAPTPAPAQGPRPAPPAPAPQAGTPAPANATWADRPLTPGRWTYRATGEGSVAQFGDMLSVRCEKAGRRIAFARAGSGSGAMTIRTSYGATSWPASPAGGETVAMRGASDAVLDQITYSRGRFAVEVAGLAPLILPPWAEVARVIEDCRG